MRVPIQTPYGTFEVFTKRVGNSTGRPMLALHGGPGLTHESLAPLAALNADVILHEQLGSAFSDQPDDDRLWTVERFVDEVEQVRRAYGLDDFVLYGHSWGAVIAVEYALAHGAHLAGLVLSNMQMSIAQYNASMRKLIAAIGLPTDDPAFLPRITTEGVCRMSPWPEALTRSYGQLATKVLHALRGTDPWLVGGQLAGWDRRADLHRLMMPTLVIGATHDLGPDDLRAAAALIPRGQYAQCSGGHFPMWDDREVYLQHLQSFLG